VTYHPSPEDRADPCDRLHLNWVDANPALWGDQPFTFIGAAPFSGTPGEINYVHADGLTYIQLQIDADPGVDAMLRIAGTVTPEASWFLPVRLLRHGFERRARVCARRLHGDRPCAAHSRIGPASSGVPYQGSP
jgi:hypothetical protein